MSAFFAFELEPPPWLYRLLVRLGLMQRLYRRLAADLAAAAPHHGLLVDVGAGTGRLLQMLTQRRTDLRLLAVDWSATVLRPHLPPGAGPADSAGLWRLVGDAAALPLETACCDMAVATFSFHTWNQPAQGLREMRRIVRPGGHIWLYEMNREASREQLKALAQEEGLPCFLVAAGFSLLSWNHALGAKDFARSFEQAGLQTWDLQPAHHFLWRAIF